MCGIVGISGIYDLSSLESGLSAISHRGPDDSGIFVDKKAGVGLGHSRLSILDPSPLGHQPMLSSDNQVVLVFNGEIYNFRELRTNLISQGFQFRSQSDSEVLLNLYLAEGKDLLPKLNGIFTFAIWDGRQQSLFIARDGLGVKPLYYTTNHDHFAFASEIKALLRLVHVYKELDYEAIQRYLTFLWCPGDQTPLKFVKKLIPGEALIIRAGRIEKQWTWYQLPLFRNVKSEQSETSSVNGTNYYLRQAVQRQMVSDVPLGAFLSGGLDSSAVVAFAREQTPDIRCFTIENKNGQEDGVADDLPYAQRVAKHLNVPLDVVSVAAHQMADDLESMVIQLDEPLADPAPLNVMYICQLARKNGIKVLLSGAGGDDLFTGYRRHHAVQLERFWNWLPPKVKGGMESITKYLDTRNPFQRRLVKFFNGAGLKGDERLVNYFRWSSDQMLQTLFTPEFKEHLNEVDAAQPMYDFLKPLSESFSSLERMLALEQRYFLTDHNLNYTDKMSMATGVEVRVPFLDLDLVDFSASIPIEYKQRGNEGKWVLKKAMEPYLPRDVIYRPKSGFGVPLRRWMRYDLRELLGDILSAKSLKRRGLFSPQTVQQLIADNDTGKIDGSYTLLSLLCIEIWCRAYIDL
jgi:asparagine synthase (glutamine-hydrolysing)